MAELFWSLDENGSPYIKHHGIPNMRWGVRHGPPYPIRPGNPVHIKKGTKLSRLSVYDEKGSKGHAYVTFNKEDIERYKGHFGRKLYGDHFRDSLKPYVHDITAKEDLNSPGKKERINTFINMYKKDPAVAAMLSEYDRNYGNVIDRILPKSILDKKYRSLDDEKVLTKGYSKFVLAIGGHEALRKAYIKNLSKKGYNFVIDDYDSGAFGIEPAIVFDRQSSLNYNGKRILEKSEVRDALRKYGQYVFSKDRHEKWA